MYDSGIGLLPIKIASINTNAHTKWFAPKAELIYEILLHHNQMFVFFIGIAVSWLQHISLFYASENRRGSQDVVTALCNYSTR